MSFFLVFGRWRCPSLQGTACALVSHFLALLLCSCSCSSSGVLVLLCLRVLARSPLLGCQCPCCLLSLVVAVVVVVSCYCCGCLVLLLVSHVVAVSCRCCSVFLFLRSLSFLYPSAPHPRFSYSHVILRVLPILDGVCTRTTAHGNILLLCVYVYVSVLTCVVGFPHRNGTLSTRTTSRWRTMKSMTGWVWSCTTISGRRSFLPVLLTSSRTSPLPFFFGGECGGA